MSGFHSHWSSGNLIFYNKSAIGIMQVGEFSSATAGSGLALSSNRSAAFRVYSDDGGVALTTGAYRCAIARHLHATALTTGDISIYGFQGQIKAVANCSGISKFAGVWAYAESSGSISIGCAVGGIWAGLVARVDAPSGVTIAASSYVSAIGIDADLGGTHTGKASCIHIVNPMAGVWDAFLSLDTTTGVIADVGAGGGTSKYLKVLLNGVAYSILVKSDA